MPSAASMETVKLVPWRERFCSTMGRNPRRWACAAVIGMQTSPRPCLARKLIFSGLTNCAANTRSPSFSRSSSSTRITISPARMPAMISVIGLMAVASLRMARFYALLLGGSLGAGLLAAASDLLPDAGGLARARAQVIELRAAHVAFALHLDRGDERRVGLESALDALARGDLAHDERGVEAAVAPGDHHALEGLHALALAFHHVDVDDHRVAGREVRHVLLQALDLFLLECLDQIHINRSCVPAGTPPATCVLPR